jgi:uncharacterized protein (DUF2141 family)
VLIIVNLQSEEQKGNLTVIIKGLRNAQGMVLIALYNSEQGFPGKSETAVARQAVTIWNGTARAVFKDCPYGTYAVSFFHDENGNTIMDTGLFGIPTEGYGFSNDAKGNMGPASFADAAFNFVSKEKEIVLTVAY